MDQPPLIAVIAWLVRHVLGESLLAVRFLPAVAGAALVLVSGMMARELGAAIFENNFGEAGAIDLLGPKYGLSKAIGNHQSYFLWGPRNYTGEIMIVLGDTPENLGRWCGSVEVAEPLNHPYARPGEKPPCADLPRVERQSARGVAAPEELELERTILRALSLLDFLFAPVHKGAGELMHEKLMQEAIRVAEEAYGKGHPPFGVVIVQDGSVIGRGHNSVEKDNDPTAHSEMQAIRDACRSWGHADLSGCDLYTILEPCPMCAAAIVWARIQTVIIGARNPAYGAAVSRKPTIFEQMKHVHKVNVVEGVLGDQCRELVSRMRHAAISDGGA